MMDHGEQKIRGRGAAPDQCEAGVPPVCRIEAGMQGLPGAGLDAGMCRFGNPGQIVEKRRLVNGGTGMLEPSVRALLEPQPECFVAGYDGGEGALEAGEIERFPANHPQRLIVAVRDAAGAADQPVLDRRDRHRIHRRCCMEAGAVRFHWRDPGRYLDKAGNRWMFQQQSGARVETDLAHAGRGPQGDEGVAPEPEEIVVDTDTIQFQEIGPDPRDGGFRRIAGRARRGCVYRRVGLRQGGAVELACRAARQPVEDDPSMRPHPFGQSGANPLAFYLRDGMPVAGNDIGGQTVVPECHGRLAYRRIDL